MEASFKTLITTIKYDLRFSCLRVHDHGHDHLDFPG